ncbi:MAG: hypothetical protein KJO31_12840 [Gammaproteobacteria bacterium]|nr:hypothetical protein [Gammaproteobacteria bacterium]
MVRLLTATFLSPLLLALVSHADEPARHDFTTGADFSFIQTNGVDSWTDGFVGKLRYDDFSDGLTISRGFLEHRFRLADTLDTRVAIEAYDDNLGPAADFTEAFLEWRPVPRSRNRYRFKLGAFYPRVSMENVDPGWSSPYTLSSSAINSWIAEEIKTIGAELSVSRRPQSLGGRHTFVGQVAVFYANDPAGSLLAWKGWSVHDRQTRFGDKLPLPPLPQIQPGRLMERQDPFVAPFREIDNRAGYYLNGEWRIGQRFALRAMHYDNRGDPEAVEGGQYAWRTKFVHVGAQATLPLEIGLIGQWMRGSTVMGSPVDGVHLVDTEFDSLFLLLTRRFDKHRISARYDNFEVTQNDSTPEDNNPESGHTWTLAYRYSASDNVQLAAEWLSIKTHHCGWVYYGILPTHTEQQLQLSLRFQFGN